jgi:hypothetical protein
MERPEPGVNYDTKVNVVDRNGNCRCKSGLVVGTKDVTTGRLSLTLNS